MIANERYEIETRLRGAGLKMTSQRYAVLDYLTASEIHPTAEQIRAALNRKFPRASRATVYNTLNALRDAGLVHEVYVDDAVARYDVNIEPHHHFVCGSCGHLEDIPLSAISAVSCTGLAPDYSIEGYAVVVRGVCSSCKNRRSGKKDPEIDSRP
jgi:Fe2+ or Zn2+ uptake regulation protein